MERAALLGVASDFLKDYNLRYGNTSEFQRYAGGKESLASLYPDFTPSAPSFVIPEEISVAFDRRGVPKLVDVLALPDACVTDLEKAKALRYLLSMLATQERKAEAISAGAPGPLVHHLTSTDAVVRELSCRSLCALAMLVEGRAAVVAAEGVPAVTKLLADQLPGARTAAAETLAALSAGPEGHVAVLASTSGALQRVVTMMEDPTSPTSALLAGLVMLSNCTGNDGGIYKALDAHVPSVLLRLAVAEDSGFELQAGCGRVLRNLAQHTYGRVQVIDAGGLNVVAQLLVSNDEELQALAGGCFMGLTMEEAAKMETIRLSGETLAELLHHPNVDIAENALATFQNCAELPAARAIIESILHDEDLLYVYPDE